MENQKIIIRLKSQQGFTRIQMNSNETYGQLKQKVQQQLNMKDLQLLLNNENGTKIIALDSTQLNLVRQITNGVQLWAKGIMQQEQKQSKIQDKQKMQEESKDESDIVNKCNHGAGGKCLNCIINFQDDIDKIKKWQCKHGPNGKCPNCVDTQYIQAKHISFDSFLAKMKMNCKHKQDQKCNNCMPPQNQNYKPNKDCKNHLPFPQAMCNKCMPQNCITKRQEFRHIDYVEFMNYQDMQGFISGWVSEYFMVQRQGLLFGYFSEDPNYKDGIRAVVEAVYTPPQMGDMNGVQLLNDPNEYNVYRIAEALTLEPIGWIYTDINHDTFMDSTQLRKAAHFQQQHVHLHPCEYNVSKYVTVVVKTGKENQDQVTPEAYMVSDQCQALERDNVLTDSSDKNLIQKRQPIDENDEGKSVEQIETEFFLVNLAHGQPKTNEFAIIKHGDFPKANQKYKPNMNDLKNYLKKYRNEKNHSKYSDFHLLVYISQILDIESAIVLAQAVGKEQEVNQDIDMIIKSMAGL